VDVSLRGKVGSTDVLIILECRDRKSSEDVTWIEQLATKRDDIGANKAIAISSTGFTSGAKLKANSKNIELRTIEDINIDTISNWFISKNIISRSISLQIDSKIDLRYPRKDQKRVVKLFNDLKSETIASAKIFLDNKNEDPISIKNLICKKYRQDIESCREPRIHILFRKGTLTPQNQSLGFLLLIDDKKAIIDRIHYIAKIDVTVTQAPIQSVKSYKTEESNLANIIRFEHSDLLEPDQSIEVVGISDGEGKKIGIRVVKNNPKQIDLK